MQKSTTFVSKHEFSFREVNKISFKLNLSRPTLSVLGIEVDRRKGVGK
jgi:hypothetical protein